MAERIYPVAANEETLFPFAVYTIEQREFESKDSDLFVVTLSTFFEYNQYESCAEFTDAMTVIIKDKWDWVASEIGFVQENQSFTGNITFNINK